MVAFGALLIAVVAFAMGGILGFILELNFKWPSPGAVPGIGGIFNGIAAGIFYGLIFGIASSVLAAIWAFRFFKST
jgi:hypothetical protein